MSYNIGDTLYQIEMQLNALSRKRLSKVDADGVEWYRYDKTPKTFSLIEHKIVGKLSKIAEGVIPDYEDVATEYFTDKGLSIYNLVENNDYWFTDKKAAEAALAHLRKQNDSYS
jgi:hypothetical protein